VGVGERHASSDGTASPAAARTSHFAEAQASPWDGSASGPSASRGAGLYAGLSLEGARLGLQRFLVARDGA